MRGRRSSRRHVSLLWRGQPVDRAWTGSLAAAFLPEGYPGAVSDDYLAYQIWDTVQALASSLIGTLATAGMLQAAGVGDAQASALSAALAWLVGDGVGHVARILFAWRAASSLSAYAKQFRLLADVANDAWLFVGILAGAAWLRRYYAVILCVRALLMAIVGVAGAATRAAVVVHQAVSGNVSDVAAKDGSQETLVNLCSLLLGLIFVPIIVARGLAWPFWALLAMVHIYANYRAVTSLQFRYLNPWRYDLAIEAFRSTGSVGSVASLNASEPIWPWSIALHCRRYPTLHLGAASASELPSGAVFGDGYVLIEDERKILLQAESSEDCWLLAYYHMRTGSIEKFEDFVASCIESGIEVSAGHLCTDEYRIELSSKRSKSRSKRRN